MAYVQYGILAIIGLIVFGVFLGYFIDLNKDASYHNRRQKSVRPPLRMVKSPRRPVNNGRTQRAPQPNRGPRRPEKRK